MNGTSRGGRREISKVNGELDFVLYGSWEALAACKILLQDRLTISTPGKPIPEESYKECFVDVVPIRHLMKFGTDSYSVSTELWTVQYFEIYLGQSRPMF